MRSCKLAIQYDNNSPTALIQRIVATFQSVDSRAAQPHEHVGQITAIEFTPVLPRVVNILVGALTDSKLCVYYRYAPFGSLSFCSIHLHSQLLHLFSEPS